MQHQRARRVITRGPIRVVGIFPSTKSGHTLHWESQLERDRMYGHEIDPHVRSFREQPETYDVKVGDKWCRYTPDLEVIFHSGAIIIEEIKPAERVAKEISLYRAFAHQLESQGICFRVVTDTEIRRQPYFSNVRHLLPFRHFDAWTDLAPIVLAAFKDADILTLGTLKANLAAARAPVHSIWTLLAGGQICTDLEKPLQDASLLQLNHGALL